MKFNFESVPPELHYWRFRGKHRQEMKERFFNFRCVEQANRISIWHDGVRQYIRYKNGPFARSGKEAYRLYEEQNARPK
jgi:hypothetical protein